MIPVRASHISDGFLGLLLSVPGLLNSFLDLGVQLSHVRLQLLLRVQQTGVLQKDNRDETPADEKCLFNLFRLC